VLDLLLSDETNPRSAVFQILTLSEHMRHLPGAGDDAMMSADQRIVLRVSNELRLADPADLGAATSRFDTRVELDRLVRRIDRDVSQLSDHIAEHYFSAGARRVESPR
jgi:uncharacterized alpha-E superfamily protein